MISLIPLFLVILGVVVVVYALVGMNSNNKATVVPAVKSEEPIINSGVNNMSNTKNNIVATTPTYQTGPVSLGVWTGFKLGFGFAIGSFLAMMLIMLVFGFIFAGAIASMFASLLGGFGF